MTPRVLREVKPQYTSDAMRARIQGVVLLECVVQPNGVCTEIQVVRSLDPTFGLDQEAIEALQQWRFEPGTRLGQPVPVLVTVELAFTLR
jgi:TonB family protein